MPFHAYPHGFWQFGVADMKKIFTEVERISEIEIIENEGVHVIEARYCLLCGEQGTLLHAHQRDRLFGVPGKWGLMRCPRCQLVWLNPQPTPDDAGKLYANYFTHQTPDYDPNRQGGLRKAVKASILQSSYGYKIDGSKKVMGSVLSCIGPLREIVGSIVRGLEFSENGRLLDVGCGNGRFLDQMRQLGWEVAGIEPDGEAVSIAREKFGLDVFQGSLEDAMFADEHFDAITINHVIEHVRDPIVLLKECRRVLKPGGKLVAVTPNMKSLGHRAFGEYWRGLEIPRHRYLFTTQALGACANSAGLDIQDLRTTARSAPWMWATSSLIRRDGALPGSLAGKFGALLRLQCLAFLALEYGLSGRWEAGEELVLEATR